MMKTRRVRSALLLAALLAGCQTMSPEQLAAAHDARCRSYGAQPGTELYLACRLELSARHEAAEAIRRQQIREALSEGLANAGEAMYGS